MVETLARSLVKMGHQVRVIGSYPANSPSADYEEVSGVRVWRLREPSHRFGWVRSRRRLFKILSDWCAKDEVDLIEVPDFHGPAAFWTRLTVPVVTRLHGSASYFAKEMGQTPERVTYALEKRSLRRADFTCSVSQYAYDRTVALFNLRAGADVIYNPVELFLCVPMARRDRNRVVFTGTLTVKKGIVSLIKAWPRVKQLCESAELDIFGKDGKTDSGESMKKHLVSLLGDDQSSGVRLHGHVSREQVVAALKNARLAVFPSYAESFGLAPVEAMAQGCPTIYTQRPPGPEIMRNRVDGLMVEPDKPAEIADAIVSLLKNDQLAESLGAAGYKRAKEMFSLEAVIPQNEAFYLRCIDEFRFAGDQILRSSVRREAAAGAVGSVDGC